MLDQYNIVVHKHFVHMTYIYISLTYGLPSIFQTWHPTAHLEGQIEGISHDLGTSEFVSWDDEIPNMMGKIKNVPNHQPVYIYMYV